MNKFHLLFYFITFCFVRLWPKKDPPLLWIRSNFTNPSLLLQPLVHSTSWKFSLNFVHFFRTSWIFSTKFGSFDPSFNRSILKLLCLIIKTSAHAKAVFIHYYILFPSCLTWYEFETYIWDTFWSGIWKGDLEFDKWSWSMILSAW